MKVGTIIMLLQKVLDIPAEVVVPVEVRVISGVQ